MNADNAAHARMGKLRKEAERLGVHFSESTTEDVLKEAIRQHKEFLKGAEEAKAATTTKAADDDGMMKLANAISTALVKGQVEAARQSKEGYEDMTHEIDPADQGEMKVYYAPCWFWVLPPKKVSGRLQRAPYRKIVFKHDHGSAIRVGDQWQTKYTCIFATDNKKEQAYMETHPKFNKMFFLSSKGETMTSEKAKFAQVFGRYVDSLRTVHHNELMPRGAALGLSFSHDMSLHTMRTMIAEKLANDEIEREKQALQRAVDEDKRLSLLKQST